ncbi:MAG: nucleotidyltransferase [Opitutales bacterium]|nr:nucleotidyltransferase [Opitutales bacterium]
MGKTLLILAAGMGSRYGGLKQIEGFGPNGETILEYSLYDALEAGFTEFVFVIRKDMEDLFREKILSRLPEELNVKLSFQALDDLPEGYTVPDGRVKPWGTGHAVWVARKAVSHPFALVNADDFYGRMGFYEVARFFDEYEDQGKCHAVVAYPVSQTLSEHGSVSRGVCEVSEDGNLVKVEEHAGIHRNAEGVIVGRLGESEIRMSDETPVSMNLLGFFPSVFDVIDRDLKQFLSERIEEEKSEFYIPAVVNGMINNSEAEIKVLNANEKWLGVTHAADRDYVVNGIRERISKGEYPEKLWS